ncbi:MAG: SH3 domain-containing protein [bacterium]|nr:SH3 domain-containing protein [bacterium]MCM1375349.1 SH3 domain-containing protein [Muribaculum sp.]
MKKRAFIALLAVMTAGTITACGNSANSEETLSAAAVMAEGSIEVPEEESTLETEEELSSAEEEAKTEESIAEQPETEETETEEPQGDVPGEQADTKTEVLNVPQTMLSSTEVSAENMVYDEVTQPVAESPVTPAIVAEPYTFTELDTVMYAKSAVNVRSLPSTDGERVGRLTSGMAVTVTGRCSETGWYRISLNSADCYVSDSYLVAEAPVTTTPDVGSVSVAEVPVVETAVAEESGVMPDFITYLNAQRQAAGLGTLEWDEGLASIALARAKEMVSDFSHNGMRTDIENIYKGCSVATVDVYNAWGGSPGHKAAMFRELAVSGACAYYKSGEFYYIAFVGSERSMTQEEWQTKITEGVADGSMTQHTDEETGLTATYTTAGTIEYSNDSDILSKMEELDRAAGLIP